MKKLSRHEKHPVPWVIGWGAAAAPGGALFEGRHSNDLSLLCGLQWRAEPLPLRCCFQIRPASATNAGEGEEDHRLRVSLVTLEHRDRFGRVTGLVQAEDIEGSPIACWPP